MDIPRADQTFLWLVDGEGKSRIIRHATISGLFEFGSGGRETAVALFGGLHTIRVRHPREKVVEALARVGVTLNQGRMRD